MLIVTYYNKDRRYRLFLMFIIKKRASKTSKILDIVVSKYLTVMYKV